MAATLAKETQATVDVEGELATLVTLLQVVLEQLIKDMTVETVLQQAPILQEEEVAQVAQVEMEVVRVLNVDMAVPV